MSCNYSSISNFGASAGNSPQTDPLSYCLVPSMESGFYHQLGGSGSMLGPESSQCQLFMAQYCATNFDQNCHIASQNTNNVYPNTVAACGNPNGSCSGPGIGNGLTQGQFLLRNAAAEKYLVSMSDNCVRVYEPFDPTVASSPMISRWRNSGSNCNGIGNCYNPNNCIGIYDVDHNSIDNDPLMNRILVQPWVATDILVNIYRNRRNTRKLDELRHTKLGRYFASREFQSIVH